MSMVSAISPVRWCNLKKKKIGEGGDKNLQKRKRGRESKEVIGRRWNRRCPVLSNTRPSEREMGRGRERLLARGCRRRAVVGGGWWRARQEEERVRVRTRERERRERGETENRRSKGSTSCEHRKRRNRGRRQPSKSTRPPSLTTSTWLWTSEPPPSFPDRKRKAK